MDSSQHIVPYLMLVIGAFTVKQFIADFVLQTNWMAQGKARLVGWQLPLLAHSATHGIFTLLITLAFQPHLWWFALVDFGVHLVIDFSKSKIGHLTGWGIADGSYWMLFGLDQFLHHATGLALSYFIVTV